jgi:hypothetical protein
MKITIGFHKYLEEAKTTPTTGQLKGKIKIFLLLKDNINHYRTKDLLP